MSGVVRVYARSAITGAWEEHDVQLDAWSVTEYLNERDTASVTLIDTTGVRRFQRGESIRIEADGVPLLRGFVMSSTEERLAPGGIRRHHLEVVDNTWLADKRIHARGWRDTPAGRIVKDLISDVLTHEGVIEGNIHDGPTIREFTINYAQVSAALEELRTRTGFWWSINDDRTLDFGPPNAIMPPTVTLDTTSWALDNTDGMLEGHSVTLDLSGPPVVEATSALADSVSVNRSAPDYRNTQWVRGGRDLTDEQTEEFAGDGVRRSFTVGFPIALEPTVEVNRGAGWAIETVGVAGLQTGRQWTWAHQSHTLTQANDEPVLTPTDRVRVTYVGEFSIVTQAQATSEVIARSLVEGGTGIVDHVITDATAIGREAGIQRASQLVEQYARASTIVRFATRSKAFRPGSATTVNLPQDGLDGAPAIVESVEWHSVNGDVRAVVTVTAGPSRGSWASFFERLARRNDAALERAGGETDAVTIPKNYAKTWVEAERPNIFLGAFPGPTVLPGPHLVPAFAAHERITHLAWLNPDGSEAGRKRVTQQTGITTDELTTIVMLGANEAVGEWAGFAWVGGPTATDNPHTGHRVVVVLEAWSKTDVEQIQVTRVDTKGW